MLITELLDEAPAASAEVQMWAYTHPSATEDVKAKILYSPSCPPEVLELGYRESRARLRRIAFSHPTTGPSWETLLRKEKSFEVIDKMVRSTDKRAEDILLQAPPKLMARSVPETVDRHEKDHTFLLHNRMPRLFWTYATPAQQRKLTAHMKSQRLASEECTDEQFTLIVSTMWPTTGGQLDALLRNDDIWGMSFRRLLNTYADRLTRLGFDAATAAEACAAFDAEQERQRQIQADDRARKLADPGLVLDANPWLTEDPWPADSRSTIECEGIPMQTLAAVAADRGDYLGAALIINQMAPPDEWSPTFQRYVKVRPDPAVVNNPAEVLAAFMRWAIDDYLVYELHLMVDRMNITYEQVSSVIVGLYADRPDVMEDMVVKAAGDLAVYSQPYERESGQIVADILFSCCADDLRVGLLRKCSRGRQLIAEALLPLPAAMVASIEVLADSWTGTLPGLIEAATLMTSDTL